MIQNPFIHFSSIFFLTMSLNLVATYSLAVFALFPVSECYCFHYFLALVTNLVSCLGIIAISWDIYYSEYVTNRWAMGV